MEPKSSIRQNACQKVEVSFENTHNLDFYQDTIKDIIVNNRKIEGDTLGNTIRSKSVVLTNGTLNGLIHIGENYGGGRAGESVNWINLQPEKARF